MGIGGKTEISPPPRLLAISILVCNFLENMSDAAAAMKRAQGLSSGGAGVNSDP